ncbi:MAG: hypothetical protein ACTSWY_10750 [Promethearchaeota archaeon]
MNINPRWLELKLLEPPKNILRKLALRLRVELFASRTASIVDHMFVKIVEWS